MWEKLGTFGWHLVVALNDTGNETPEAQRVWRRLVASLLTIIVLTIGGGFAWAQGWTPLSGVALASDLAQLRTEVTLRQGSTDATLAMTQLIVVKSAIRQALVNRCLAIHRFNQPALDAANGELDGLADQYSALLHQPLTIPSCDVILIQDNSAHP